MRELEPQVGEPIVHFREKFQTFLSGHWAYLLNYPRTLNETLHEFPELTPEEQRNPAIVQDRRLQEHAYALLLGAQVVPEEYPEEFSDLVASLGPRSTGELYALSNLLGQYGVIGCRPSLSDGSRGAIIWEVSDRNAFGSLTIDDLDPFYKGKLEIISADDPAAESLRLALQGRQSVVEQKALEYESKLWYGQEEYEKGYRAVAQSR